MTDPHFTKATGFMARYGYGDSYARDDLADLLRVTAAQARSAALEAATDADLAAVLAPMPSGRRESLLSRFESARVDDYERALQSAEEGRAHEKQRAEAAEARVAELLNPDPLSGSLQSKHDRYLSERNHYRDAWHEWGKEKLRRIEANEELEAARARVGEVEAEGAAVQLVVNALASGGAPVVAAIPIDGGGVSLLCRSGDRSARIEVEGHEIVLTTQAGKDPPNYRELDPATAAREALRFLLPTPADRGAKVITLTPEALAELKQEVDRFRAWNTADDGTVRGTPGLFRSVEFWEALIQAAERVAELEAENERLRGELIFERSSVGRADLQTKALLASDQRDRAWALLRELGVTVMP